MLKALTAGGCNFDVIEIWRDDWHSLFIWIRTSQKIICSGCSRGDNS
jgi:hypothetical protein